MKQFASLILLGYCAMLPLFGQAPTWSVDANAYSSSMTIVGRVVLDGLVLDQPQARVSAWQGSTLRGVADVNLVDGQALFFLSIYGAPSETATLSFQVWHPSKDSVYTVLNTITYEADARFGRVGEPYVWANTTANNQPNWTVNPAAYPASMSMVGQIFVQGQRLRHPNDQLVALVGDSVRGIATPVDINGQTLFFLTVYGDGAANETVTFRVYDAAADLVRDLAESVEFTPEAISGSLGQPFTWNMGIGFGRPTWDSQRVTYPSSMSVVGAVLIDGVRSTHPTDLLAAFVGDEVRGVARPTFVDGQQQFFLQAYGDASARDTLTFKAYAYDPISGEQRVFDLSQRMPFAAETVAGQATQPLAFSNGALAAERPDTWTAFRPNAFPASMQVVGVLRVASTYIGEQLVQDVVAAHPEDMVAAFVGDALRGVAKAEQVQGRSLFYLNIYGETQGSETLTFKAYYAAADKVVDVDQTLEFAAHTTIGSFGKPVEWQGGPIPLEFSVATEDFDASMVVNGQVTPQGGATALAGDVVAAFVGEEVRGTANLTAPANKRGSRNALDFSMQIVGDEADDTVIFKTYSLQTNELSVIEETVPFEEDAEVGDAENPVSMTATQPLQLSLRVFLEGAYAGDGRMNTWLRQGGFLTKQHPYTDTHFNGTPLAYAGEDSVSTIPVEAVDWVLVDLRSDATAASFVARKAALLLSNGEVVHSDGVSPLRFQNVEPGAYYVVVRHRNHLPVMTSTPLRLDTTPTLHNFSTAQSQAAGSNPMKQLAAGVFGLYSGDSNGSGGVTASDNALWLQVNGTAGYFPGDFNLTGGATAFDHIFWVLNNGLGGQVPE